MWIEVCKKHPEALISAPRNVDVGPLEGMLLELEFNQSIVSGMADGTSAWQEKIGSALHDKEYMRAIEQGSLLLLSDDLREIINDAYSRVSQINTILDPRN